MIKILHAGCLGLSPAISTQLPVEMFTAAKNCEKIHQNPSFGGSKSSTLTNLKSPLPVLVMMCSNMYLSATVFKITFLK